MAVLNRLKSFLTALVAPTDSDSLFDATAYHAPALEKELRFSPRNVLRRHY